MRKNRNAFFAETNSMGFNNMFPNNMTPYGQASQQNSSFYAGPMVNNGNSELDSRLSKIERQIQRLDARVSKLENGFSTNSLNNDLDNNSSMYMI